MAVTGTRLGRWRARWLAGFRRSAGGEGSRAVHRQVGDGEVARGGVVDHTDGRVWKVKPATVAGAKGRRSIETGHGKACRRRPRRVLGLLVMAPGDFCLDVDASTN